MNVEESAIHGVGTAESLADDYVAWCRYVYDGNGGIQSIVTCDSDAKGAFKVCRHRGR